MGEISFRRKEVEWLETHRDELQSLTEKWVVVEGDTLIAFGTDYMEVVAQAKAQGITIPFVVFIPQATEGYFMGLKNATQSIIIS